MTSLLIKISLETKCSSFAEKRVVIIFVDFLKIALSVFFYFLCKKKVNTETR